MAGVIEPIGMMALLLGRRGLFQTATKFKIMVPMTAGIRSCTSSTSPKSKQAVIIKRLRKENKDIFGELLETKYDKVKREKKAAKKSKKGVPLISEPALPVELKSKTLTKNNTENELEQRKALVEDRTIGTQNEINWSLKNFPDRAKMLRRSNPETEVQNFGKITFPSGYYKVFKKDPTTSKTSAKEIQNLPTMKQVNDSFQESLDILPSFQVKVVRKEDRSSSPGQTPSVIDTDKMDPIKNEENTSNVGKIGENDASHSLDKNDDAKSRPLSFLSSVDPPMDLLSFPYDNPDKKTNKNSETQDGIISIPFPIKISHDSSEPEKQQQIPQTPSVSKILNATISPEQAAILKKWEEKMVAKLGELGFLRYKEGLFANGKKFHANIQSVLSGTPEDELVIEESISGHWKSLQSIFPKIERVHVLESRVFHPELNYCGIVDCVAKFRDKLVVIDWKTSEKPKPVISMTYDTPLQIAAYVGALNYDPNYFLKIHAGLVVIAYQDGKDCQTYFLNSSQIDTYWKQWLKRLRLYQNQTQSQNNP